jgi:signal transduction histidine kinase
MIKDTGAGISEEIASEIFKPFFSTKTRGSGLGLACVERIVKDHKGNISVKSEIGKGTEFMITLPVWN